MDKQIRQEDSTANRHGNRNYVLSYATCKKIPSHIIVKLFDSDTEPQMILELFVSNHIQWVRTDGK